MTLRVLDSGVFLDGGPWESLKKSLKGFDPLWTGGAGGEEKNYALNLLTIFALVKDLFGYATELGLESLIKDPNSMPEAFRQASKPEQFFERADKIIEVLDKELVPISDLAAIACGGDIEQRCSQCRKEIIVSGILQDEFTVKRSAVIVFNPIEMERYVCEAPECFEKEKERKIYQITSWSAAVMATFNRLQQTRCNYCFLVAPLKEVHRSKCLTKNYCSQTCRNADDGVHKICCNKDKSLQLIDERKVKVGGKEKVEMANSRSDEWANRFTSSLSHRPALAKNVQKIFSRAKKANP